MACRGFPPIYVCAGIDFVENRFLLRRQFLVSFHLSPHELLPSANESFGDCLEDLVIPNRRRTVRDLPNVVSRQLCPCFPIIKNTRKGLGA